MRFLRHNVSLLLLGLFTPIYIFSQDIQRPIPNEWSSLVKGGCFKDLFKTMPKGKISKKTWGCNEVKNRYVDNGIESDSISYWGGNIIKGNDNKYHFFLCGWKENNPNGHMGYNTASRVYHAVGNSLIGPFEYKQKIGDGHNAEVMVLKDNRYFIYHIDGYNDKNYCRYYLSDNLYGPWKDNVLPLDERDRKVLPGKANWFHNMTFTKRQDGSVLMINRGGQVWISKDGTSTYNLLSEKSEYPLFDARYEDPVVWRDNVQYNMIVNDWYGRVAFYLRSKDGYHWVTDPGQAYTPGISKHNDGMVENWYKYERIRIHQDEQGRAIQANFAVIDTIKKEDLPNDNHSSKNISIPLTRPMLLSLESKERITFLTKEIKVRIKGEKDFNPIKEVDVKSLHFGASSEVNYGRGALAISSKSDGNDLIVTFSGKNHCIGDKEFAPKLIGKNKKGKLIFGYTQLPWVDYSPAYLSASRPYFNEGKLYVKVSNFGLKTSLPETISLIINDGSLDVLGYSIVPELKPYEEKIVEINMKNKIYNNSACNVIVKISSSDDMPTTFSTSLKL